MSRYENGFGGSRRLRRARAAVAVVGVVGVSAIAGAASAQVAAVQLPQNPREGACYAKVWIPGETQQRPQRVVVQDASEQLVVTPAKYEWVEKQVEIEAASQRIEVVPARFGTEERTVVIEPERREVTVKEPVYEAVDKAVLVRAAYTTWRPCDNQRAARAVPQATGEVMCFVTVPAEYRTVKAQVLKEPARLLTKTIPAKTRTIKVRVMTRAPQQRVIRVPAKTQTFRVLEEVSPLRTARRATPAKYQTVMQTVKSSDGRMEWRQVACDGSTPGASGLSTAQVRDVQRALRRRGFDPGPIDGIIGSRTRRALVQFQRRNNLAQTGVSSETLRALGIRA